MRSRATTCQPDSTNIPGFAIWVMSSPLLEMPPCWLWRASELVGKGSIAWLCQTKAHLRTYFPNSPEPLRPCRTCRDTGDLCLTWRSPLFGQRRSRFYDLQASCAGAVSTPPPSQRWPLPHSLWLYITGVHRPLCKVNSLTGISGRISRAVTPFPDVLQRIDSKRGVIWAAIYGIAGRRIRETEYWLNVISIN